MELMEHELTALSNAVLTNDGESIAFTLNAASGPLTRLRFKLDDMPEFIAYLCEVVRQVHPDPRPSEAPVYVPALAAKLCGCDDPTIALLSFHLAGMELGMSLGTDTAAQLASQLEQMARSLRMLSAQGRPQ